MPLKRPTAPEGRIVHLQHDSSILRDNPLGDPHQRTFPVWLPPQYDGSGNRRFPVLWDLVGFMGAGPAHVDWQAFAENVPERAARLVHARRMPPAIIVFPDCFTALGGNQYVNSSAVGRYADYLTRELIPFVDRELRTLASREHRGCFGKSSGGYGAIVHGMRYAKYWGAVANHSGDSAFEMVYWPDWPNTLDELAKFRDPPRKPGVVDARKAAATPGLARGEDDGRILRFLRDAWTRDKLSTAQGHALMNLCMAATYDPDPTAPNGFRVPFNLESGEVIPERWRTWLRSDPVRMARVKSNQDALRTLRGIYLDCGWRDQYHIHYGMRQLSAALAGARIAHVYEEFDDTHSGINYRMDTSLPFLARALR